MKHSINLLLILLTCLIWSCQDNETFDSFSDYRLSDSCLAPKSIGPSHFAKDNNDKTDIIDYIWNEVDDAKFYDFRFYINNEKNPSIFLEGIKGNEITVKAKLEIDDIVRAEVRSSCDGKSKSKWISQENINRNGGGSVDMVFRTTDWRRICEESGCDYITFYENSIQECGGTPINFNHHYGFQNFYSRSSICDCLSSYSTLCEGIENIRECLYPAYLKRYYEECEPEF